MMDKYGNLHLSGCTSLTALPDGLTVGGWIYLNNTIDKRELNKVKKLKDGDYVEGKYLFADGILTHIKKAKKVNQYTYYVGKIKNRNVISDGKNYAHCENLRDGVADLLFKTAANRGVDQYKNIALDDEFTVKELVTMYRIITGACKQGSKSFVYGLKNPKEKYTVREVIDLTQGQYGASAFEKFFK